MGESSQIGLGRIGGDVTSSPTGSKRSSNGSLFLTLPSNFSPSCGGGSGGGGGSGSASPKGGSSSPKGGSRASPLSSHHHSWEDLRRLFLVSLEKLSRMEPESIPFRQPVDPEELGIPDYQDIIRKPMDLQTIRNKMNNGKYTDPYGYVDDVLLMLDNAWLYNREGSKVYEYCTRLSEVFVYEVNPVMCHLGYKEGRTNAFQFNSDMVNCHGRPVCIVMKGKSYWRDTSRDIEFNLCEGCYKERFEDDNGPDVIPNAGKRSFVFAVNSSKSYSPAAEFHKSHLRDAEMSRQLVLREFLRMLIAGDTSTERKLNVYKMLRCNGKLLTEFIEYVKRRRGISGGDGECSVVYGEGFTTSDLDQLVVKLKGLKVEEKRCSVVEDERKIVGEGTKPVEEEEKARSDSGVESVVGSSNETLDLSLEEKSS